MSQVVTASGLGDRISSLRVSLRKLTLFLLLAILWLALTMATETFWGASNITNLFRQTALMSILAIGQTLVIITAGIDLSVGAMVGLSSVLVSLMMKAGMPIPAAVLLTLSFGFLVGLYHGIAIRRFGIPPFIITLASLSILTGLGLLITDGATISGLPKEFTGFARGAFLGVPNLFWVVVLVGIPIYVLLRHTRWGRYIFAVGSSPEAARLSGVNVDRTFYLVYALSSTLAALVGVLTASRISIGLATTGMGWELQSIAASVIGGASLFGAVGGVIGSLLGAMSLTTIANGANLLNVNPYIQQMVTGFLIVFIVYFDQSRRRSQ
ncbi:ABC transporter permease [Phyllobacterium chamaecytisi]|uniref:ABC transporter permease n=1 Tax=Phyllobacterium chamaecytisi TaxID=2876082 RepID=UPI001CCF43EF|nr:ABC transporter permease [Phyllobacterium sp. KW56]MBZ9606023.1 ABC transporter permease [Phyllobacterium sp. KW56]